MFNSFALTLSFLGMLFFSLSTAELLGRHRYKEFMYVMVIERTISLFAVPILFWLYGVDGALERLCNFSFRYATDSLCP